MTTPWVIGFALLWVVVILLVLVVLGLLRRISEVLARSAATVSVDDVAIGAPPLSVIRPFTFVDEDGARHAFPDFLGSPTLFLFIGADCPACEMLLEQLVDVGPTVDGVPLFVVLDRAESSARQMRLPAGLRVLYQQDSEATEAFNNRATPQAYTVDEAGVVLERRVPGALAHLREMAIHQDEKGGGSATRMAAAGEGVAVATQT